MIETENNRTTLTILLFMCVVYVRPTCGSNSRPHIAVRRFARATKLSSRRPIPAYCDLMRCIYVTAKALRRRRILLFTVFVLSIARTRLLVILQLPLRFASTVSHSLSLARCLFCPCCCCCCIGCCCCCCRCRLAAANLF